MQIPCKIKRIISKQISARCCFVNAINTLVKQYLIRINF